MLLRLACSVAAGAATVIGCGWSGTEYSVRFNSYQSERAMGRLPPLPTLASGKTDAREQWLNEAQWDDPQSDPSKSERRTAQVNMLWAKADQAELNGDLKLARALLRDYLEQTAIRRDTWFEPHNRQERRNSAIDRLDAMTALDGGASSLAVQAYLNARRAYENPNASEEASADEKQDDANVDGDETLERALARVPPVASLQDNVAYLRAALLYRSEDYSSAAARFTKLARHYATSEKREAALYMAALSLMKSSASFTGTSGDEAHLQAGSSQHDSGHPLRNEDRAALALMTECCDDAWRLARAAFTRSLEAYPRGRYSADARGWLAYLLLRASDRAAALVEYYRLLSDQHDRNARVEAAFSLTFVRHHATSDEMRRVEAQLEDEPQAALAYAYHNIFNYAIDPGCQLQSDYPNNQWEADLQAKNKDALQREELRHIVAFASRLMQRYPRAAIGGQFAVRVAGANLELGENRLAAEQAKLALSSNVRGEERARALWLKGVAEHRLHDYTAAQATLSMLVAENPDGEFTTAARRLLAMAAEDSGDIYAALEQYLSLGYEVDVAYFVDVLMSPAQLAHFIEEHPASAKLDELLYALGIRYMRERRWADARAAFARVHTSGENKDSWPNGNVDDCYAPPGFEHRCRDPKDTDYGPGISARLLLSDLKTIDDLQRLEQEAAAAASDEAQAEALYQLASYQFQSSTLLFYNPVAWRGARHYELSTLHNNNRYRVSGEAEKLWREAQQHETMALSLVIYLDIARRFPQTRAARDALYTAAVCHERLSERYNQYWHSAYATGLHAGDRMVTYKDVRTAYPDYQLPRGTSFWEPATRTVSGGPGWAAPPKPKPRPTLRARLKLFCQASWSWLAGFWKEKAGGWLMAAATLLCLLFAFSFAARARSLLRAHIGRRRCKRSLLRRWLIAYRAGQWKYFASDEVHTLARRSLHESLRLVLHPRGRALLAINLLTHVLLVMLLLAAVKIVYPG